LPVALPSHPALTPLSQQEVFKITAVRETNVATTASAFGGTNTATAVASIGFHPPSISTSTSEVPLLACCNMH